MSYGQNPWPPPGSSVGHARAGLLSVTGHVLLTVDIRAGDVIVRGLGGRLNDRPVRVVRRRSDPTDLHLWSASWAPRLGLWVHGPSGPTLIRHLPHWSSMYVARGDTSQADASAAMVMAAFIDDELKEPAEPNPFGAEVQTGAEPGPWIWPDDGGNEGEGWPFPIDD